MAPTSISSPIFKAVGLRHQAGTLERRWRPRHRSARPVHGSRAFLWRHVYSQHDVQRTSRPCSACLSPTTPVCRPWSAAKELARGLSGGSDAGRPGGAGGCVPPRHHHAEVRWKTPTRSSLAAWAVRPTRCYTCSAIASEAEVPWTLADFDRLGAKVPHLADLKPGEAAAS